MAQATNNDSNVRKEITIGGLVYILEGTVDFKITPKETGPVVPPVNPPGPDQPPKPSSFGTIKEGAKWSKNPGPSSTWKLVGMKDDPNQFKFVDTAGLNIIGNLVSKEQGEALQKYFAVNVFPPKGNDDSVPVDPDSPPTPSTGGTDMPYKTTGKTVEMTQRGVTVRHYRSGKDDDMTVEKNAKKIGFANVQAVFKIKVPKVWEHDDNLSIKGNGTHMGTGWFDNGISIFEGQTCLGKEEKHPSTQLCVVKGKKYGDLRGKTVMVASTFYRAENKTEFWVNIPGVTQGWDKAVEGKDIGGFNPGAKDETEIQLRIDGFEKDDPPGIEEFFVNEIAV